VALKRSDRAPHPVRGEWSCKRKTSRPAWILDSRKGFHLQPANVLWPNYPSGKCSTNLGNHFFYSHFTKCKYLQMKMKDHILLVSEDVEGLVHVVVHEETQAALSNGYQNLAMFYWMRVRHRLFDYLYF
jgi:hypothetical protein